MVTTVARKLHTSAEFRWTGRPLQPEKWQVSETLLSAIYGHMWGAMPENVAMLCSACAVCQRAVI